MNLTSEADKSIFRRAMDEMNASLTRQAAERDLIKEIVGRIKDTLLIEPKYTRKAAKIYYNQNKTETEAEFDEIISLCEVMEKNNV